VKGLQGLKNLEELFVFYTNEVVAILERLGGINELDGQVLEPQRVVEYCKSL